ncbi:hypothetical protein OF897_06165 [Chryseobacterium formosus]|uniref:Signal peptidase n=1 Tax=Chryseobacterium formosus TaxID=1537363 RepID=A0ABT3XPD2_9FLAO|nr:hypothetical protein [Chryseobacterium formosus]MCX8523501.1 hypothetical protein [Chryseobacterium formosus]
MKSLLNGNAKFLSSFAMISYHKNSILKKIILIGLFVLSNFVIAQNVSDNQYVYESSDEVSGDETFPGNPGDPKPVPIDNYIPILFIIGVTIVVGYSMKKKANAEINTH